MKTYICNLTTRADKFLFCLGGLAAAGFPMWGDSTPWGDHIYRYPNIDRLAVDGNPERMYAEAQSRGVTIPEEWHYPEGDGCQFIAWSLSWLGALAHHAAQPSLSHEWALILIDDTIIDPKWGYNSIQALPGNVGGIASGSARASEPHIIQLSASTYKIIGTRHQQDADFWSNCLIHSDHAVMVSKTGANLILEGFSQGLTSGLSPDYILEELYLVGSEQFRKGCWSCAHDIANCWNVRWGSQLANNDDPQGDHPYNTVFRQWGLDMRDTDCAVDPWITPHADFEQILGMKGGQE